MLGKRFDATYMLLVFAHVHNVYQNFGTCTYGDFMVIVETSGCDLKLLKVTENNLQVCIDG